MLIHFEGFLFGGDLSLAIDIVFEGREMYSKNIDLCH